MNFTESVITAILGCIVGCFLGGIVTWYFAKQYGVNARQLHEHVQDLRNYSDTQIKSLLTSAAQVLESRGALQITHNPDGTLVFNYQGGFRLNISGTADTSHTGGGMSITGSE